MLSIDELIDLLAVQMRRFLYDNFQSTENIYSAVSQTGEVTTHLSELVLSTGIQEGSTAKIYYNYPAFNPKYSTLIFKLRFDSIDDVFAFIGFKGSVSDPSFNMTESHAGLMINNGNVYFSTANEDPLNPNQQRTRIIGIDPTNVLIYKIIYNKLLIRPTPLIYPYFDGIRAVKTERAWTQPYENGAYTPMNKDHYFVAFIKNSVGLTKRIYLNHVCYGEEYAD